MPKHQQEFVTPNFLYGRIAPLDLPSGWRMFKGGSLQRVEPVRWRIGKNSRTLIQERLSKVESNRPQDYCFHDRCGFVQDNPSIGVLHKLQHHNLHAHLRCPSCLITCSSEEEFLQHSLLVHNRVAYLPQQILYLLKWLECEEIRAREGQQ